MKLRTVREFRTCLLGTRLFAREPRLFLACSAGVNSPGRYPDGVRDLAPSASAPNDHPRLSINLTLVHLVSRKSLHRMACTRRKVHLSAGKRVRELQTAKAEESSMKNVQRAMRATVLILLLASAAHAEPQRSSQRFG